MIAPPLRGGARAGDTRGGARLNSPSKAWLKQTPHLFPLRAPPTRRYTDGDPNVKSSSNRKSYGSGSGSGSGSGNNLSLPYLLANKPLFFESFSRNPIKPVIR